MTTLTKTSDLVTPAALAREFGISHITAGKWLEDAGLAAAVTTPYGRGFLRLYEPGPARDAIRAKMPKPAEPAPVAAVDAPVVLDVLEERVEALTEVVTALQEQNRALFAYVRDNIGGKLDALVKELGGVQS